MTQIIANIEDVKNKLNYYRSFTHHITKLIEIDYGERDLRLTSLKFDFDIVESLFNCGPRNEFNIKTHDKKDDIDDPFYDYDDYYESFYNKNYDNVMIKININERDYDDDVVTYSIECLEGNYYDNCDVHDHITDLNDDLNKLESDLLNYSMPS